MLSAPISGFPVLVFVTSQEINDRQWAQKKKLAHIELKRDLRENNGCLNVVPPYSMDLNSIHNVFSFKHPPP